jgi:mono/diheme cytochrome c family protein
MLATTGCTDWALYDLDVFWGNFDMISLLRESVSYDPYEMPRLPAANTIPVTSPLGDSPPPFTQQDLVSGSLPAMSNPLQPSAEVLLRGAVVYQQQCMACHGVQGLGDGPVVGPGKFPYAPSLVTPLAAGYSDEYLYGIIRVGRGLMPAYGERISHADRWATVMYVRQLQREAGPAAAAAPVGAAQSAPAAAAAGAAAPPEADPPR